MTHGFLSALWSSAAPAVAIHLLQSTVVALAAGLLPRTQPQFGRKRRPYLCWCGYWASSGYWHFGSFGGAASPRQ